MRRENQNKWNRAVHEHRDAVRQNRTECAELGDFHDNIRGLIDEW